jgi:hypothetical protein
VFLPYCQRSTGAGVVAHVGDEIITRAEMESQIDKMSPGVRERYSSVQQKRRILESLVQMTAMAGAFAAASTLTASRTSSAAACWGPEVASCGGRLAVAGEVHDA